VELYFLYLFFLGKGIFYTHVNYILFVYQIFLVYVIKNNTIIILSYIISIFTRNTINNI